jgi:hypothetical protein
MTEGLKLVRGVGVEGVEEQMRAQAPHVLICTPSLAGFPSLEFQVSMLETITRCASMGLLCDAAFVRGDPFVGKARNNLIMQFLARGAQNLFFIDDDQGWDATSFIRMVLDPHEVVAAAVPKKMDEVTYNNVDLITDEAKNCVVDAGMMKARSVGTGFMRWKRSVVEKYIAAHPETYVPGDGSQTHHHRVFEPGGAILDGQFWGEDLVWCKKWAAMGGDLWIDPNVEFAHVGRKAWRGNFLKYLQEHCKVDLAPAPPLVARAA